MNVELVESEFLGENVAFLFEVEFRFRLCALELLSFLFCDFEPVDSLRSLLVEFFEFLGARVDVLDVRVGSNDVLEVLEQSILVLRLRLWFHERDLLHLSLEDEEPVVVEVDAVLFEQVCDFGEV